MNIEDILNGTKYNLTQFSQKNITSLLERVIEKIIRENLLYMWNV